MVEVVVDHCQVVGNEVVFHTWIDLYDVPALTTHIDVEDTLFATDTIRPLHDAKNVRPVLEYAPELSTIQRQT